LSVWRACILSDIDPEYTIPSRFISITENFIHQSRYKEFHWVANPHLVGDKHTNKFEITFTTSGRTFQLFPCYYNQFTKNLKKS